MLTTKEKAQQLYRDAYMRWCYELSHEKNVLTAKAICEYVCNEVLGDMGADRGYEFWTEVRAILKNSNHTELIKEIAREEALQFLATQAQELNMGYTTIGWQVRFKDIDPDSGETSQDVCIATCDTETLAQWTKHSIENEWYSVDGSSDPNREFYIKPINY